ncbi:mediator of RNA polymerase II transcription complex subunit 8-domain-containing protein [Xylariomycetidae sp. FL2044]|nr:mediator of RNA polymerase II transcription complex subunit 8-domain-containing protein [Xylariomycetidae sp. FL2044]
MASLNLKPEELKAVEQTRQKLWQLSSNIESLKTSVFMSNPLPDLESLQNSADILKENLSSIANLLAQHSGLLSRVAVHPSTNFPGRTQQNILSQLLRKKPEPDVEAAMAEGRSTLATAAGITSTATNTGNNNTTAGGGAAEEVEADRQKKRLEDQEKELEENWAAARDACVSRIIEYAMNEESDPFTAAEREMGVENVRTGLRRNFDDEYDDDEDDEDEEGGNGQPRGGGPAGGAGGAGDDDIMIIDRPMPPPAPAVTTNEVEGASIENVMRFAARGEFVTG